MNNDDIPEDFDFFKLASDLHEDALRERANGIRTQARVMSELAAGVEADAIQAGIDKKTAKAMSLAIIRTAFGDGIALA